ncbi:hypothetical protein Goklo_017242, partial [Gossypium klotzschianum]|nr:hypothetical protein [Gossypium klotzschianum]
MAVETGRRYFPHCAEVLDKFLVDDMSDPSFFEDGSSEEQRVKKRRFTELKEELLEAFYKDKADQKNKADQKKHNHRPVLSPSSSSSSSTTKLGSSTPYKPRRKVEEVWAVEEDVDEEVDHDYCLVGCFLTTRMVNFQAMKNTLVNVWHLIGGVVISDLDEKRFLFKFYHEVDIERVIKGDPWTFNNHLLIIHRLLENEDLMEEKDMLLEEVEGKKRQRVLVESQVLEGTRGGLSLGWMEGTKVILKSFSTDHIDIEVDDEFVGRRWRF